MTSAHHELKVLDVSRDGPLLGTESDALDLIPEAGAVDAEVIAIPVERLDPAFFDLSTGVAGAFTQKLLNYRFRLAVVGDIDRYVAASSALRDYVYESNNGRQVWFVTDHAELEQRL